MQKSKQYGPGQGIGGQDLWEEGPVLAEVVLEELMVMEVMMIITTTNAIEGKKILSTKG